MRTHHESWDVHRIKVRTMEKVRSSNVGVKSSAPRRFGGGFAAAAVILTLVLATTALAVSGTINFGSIFQSIFRGEHAAPYVQTGEDITVHVSEGEVEVALLAAFLEDTRIGGLYLELEITDPTGERLSDSFMLLLQDERLGYIPLNLHMPVDVQLIDEHTAHVSFFLPHADVRETGEIVVQFDFIASNIQTVELQPTEFNIGKHIGVDGPVVVPGAAFIEITEITLDDTGRLTITSRDSDVSVYGWGHGTLGLMQPDGEIIWSRGGSMTYGIPGWEREFNIGAVNPYDLTLVWSGERAEYVMSGNWEFTISGEAVLDPGVRRGYFEGSPTEVFLGGTSVEVLITVVDSFDIFQENPLVLYLADGTTVEPRFNGAEGGFDVVTLQYSMEFIHPEDVVRVTFRGVAIGE